MTLIIDIHGHQTLVPKAHLTFRDAQKARLNDPSLPLPPLPEYADEELYEIIKNNQLKLQQERGADITVFSPRASRMEPHVGDEATSRLWAIACNNMIKRTVDLFPNNLWGSVNYRNTLGPRESRPDSMLQSMNLNVCSGTRIHRLQP